MIWSLLDTVMADGRCLLNRKANNPNKNLELDQYSQTDKGNGSSCQSLCMYVNHQNSTALRHITLGQEPVDPFTPLVHRCCVVVFTPGELGEKRPITEFTNLNAGVS